MKDINLLPQKKQYGQQGVKILRVISIALLLIVTLVSAGLFFLNLNSSYSSLQREEATLLSDIARYQDTFNKYLIIQDRLKNIASVIAKRTNYNKNLDGLLNGLPANVSIDLLSVDGKSVQMSLSSNSLSSLNTFIDNTLGQTGEKKIFKRLKMSSLSFNGKDQYLLSLEADLL